MNLVCWFAAVHRISFPIIHILAPESRRLSTRWSSKVGHCGTVCPGYNLAARAVILNRGPHGPPGGNLQVLGGIQSIWGIGEEWTPSGGINK